MTRLRNIHSASSELQEEHLNDQVRQQRQRQARLRNQRWFHNTRFGHASEPAKQYLNADEGELHYHSKKMVRTLRRRRLTTNDANSGEVDNDASTGCAEEPHLNEQESQQGDSRSSPGKAGKLLKRRKLRPGSGSSDKTENEDDVNDSIDDHTDSPIEGGISGLHRNYSDDNKENQQGDSRSSPGKASKLFKRRKLRPGSGSSDKTENEDDVNDSIDDHANSPIEGGISSLHRNYSDDDKENQQGDSQSSPGETGKPSKISFKPGKRRPPLSVSNYQPSESVKGNQNKPNETDDEWAKTCLEFNKILSKDPEAAITPVVLDRSLDRLLARPHGAAQQGAEQTGLAGAIAQVQAAVDKLGYKPQPASELTDRQRDFHALTTLFVLEDQRQRTDQQSSSAINRNRMLKDAVSSPGKRPISDVPSDAPSSSQIADKAAQRPGK